MTGSSRNQTARRDRPSAWSDRIEREKAIGTGKVRWIIDYIDSKAPVCPVLQ
jgi:Uri superfamily endonuclease